MNSLNIVSYLFSLLPVIPAIIGYRVFSPALKIFAWFIWISASFDTVFILTQQLNVQNSPLTHLFIWFNTIFLGLIYSHALPGRYKNIIFVFSIVSILFSISNTLFFQGPSQFPSWSFALGGIIFIIFSLTYFYQMLRFQEVVYIEKQYMFWISSGILIYFSGNIFLFMLRNKMIASPLDYSLYWVIIHALVNVVSNVLYTVGLLCKPQPQI